MSHTPGKLELFGKPSPSQAIATESMVIFQTVGSNDVENARRIVACWNACDGIDTEYLEGNDSMAHYARRLMLQRADLLEALQTSLPVMRSYFEALGPCDHSVGICNCDMDRAIKTVAAAIARATGEQS